jgi:hypothetical protein
MLVARDHFGGGGPEELHPPACLILLFAHAERITVERYPLGIGELAVTNARRLSDAARKLEAIATAIDETGTPAA